jgi:hypothetical protein
MTGVGAVKVPMVLTIASSKRLTTCELLLSK